MGLAIAECIAAEGASVAIMARSQSALNAAVARLRAAGAPEVLGI
jgi:3-oxoacyl-[acyl-carrier protein] reductase